MTIMDHQKHITLVNTPSPKEKNLVITQQKMTY